MNAEIKLRLMRLYETPLRLIEDPLFLDRHNDKAFLAEMPDLEEFEAKRAVLAIEAKKITPELVFLYQEPLLGKHQEFHLFRKLNLYKWKVKAFLQSGKATESGMAQVEDWLAQIAAVKRQIVYSNARITVSVAKKQREYWQRPSIDVLLMIVSDAMLGLVRAVDYFDYLKGFKFSTYATFAMYDTIKRARTDRTKHQGSYTNDEMLSHEPDPDSIEDYRGKGLEKMQEAALVTKYLKYLHHRERHIVVRSFGLDGNRVQKLRELAHDLGVSKERVRQIRDKGLAKIRRRMEEDAVTR